MMAHPAKTIEDTIGRSLDLPVLPATAQKVLGLMSDPDISIEKIKRLITTDPALATQLLKVANSAFYGGHRNIQNLTQAILRLGLNAVRNIVVATSLKNVYKRFGLTEKLIWEQMLGSALAASHIARHTRLVDAEDAFIGGLLHDVGKIVLNNEYPDKFALVMQRVYNESITFEEAVSDVFDFTHREIGVYLVRKWGFPESLEMLIRSYDCQETLASEKYLANLVTMITLADRMCQKFGMGWRKAIGDDINYGNLPESLELSPEQLAEIEAIAKDSFKQGAEFY